MQPTMEGVTRFLELQKKLTLKFLGQHPECKDLRWLFDFPKRGVIDIDGEHWGFVKHGAGLRFMYLSGEPHMIVDIHKRFGESQAIDEWRLTQFFESCGDRVHKNQLSSLLNEMCLKGYLLDQGDGRYLFRG